MLRAAPRRLRRKGGEMGGDISSMDMLCGRLQRCLMTSSRRRTALTSRAAVLAAGCALLMTWWISSASCTCSLCYIRFCKHLVSERNMRRSQTMQVK